MVRSRPAESISHGSAHISHSRVQKVRHSLEGQSANHVGATYAPKGLSANHIGATYAPKGLSANHIGATMPRRDCQRTTLVRQCPEGTVSEPHWCDICPKGPVSEPHWCDICPEGPVGEPHWCDNAPKGLSANHIGATMPRRDCQRTTLVRQCPEGTVSEPHWCDKCPEGPVSEPHWCDNALKDLSANQFYCPLFAPIPKWPGAGNSEYKARKWRSHWTAQPHASQGRVQVWPSFSYQSNLTDMLPWSQSRPALCHGRKADRHYWLWSQSRPASPWSQSRPAFALHIVVAKLTDTLPWSLSRPARAQISSWSQSRPMRFTNK
ncbi:hypothetical protein niasHT_039356 [Heterodera trifolii]|uniref:Uncharacterized protein n=1 Tax=Heterodera trifolii TaxID=157864 RepID=A0ABD2IQ95_9BILA